MWNSVRVWLSALWIAAVVLLGTPLCIPVAVGQGSNVEPGLDMETLSGLEFRSIGPALTSGRIADIAINPHNRHIWYVAVGSGGVWKTENGGVTWESIFDSEGSYSIGVVTIDPYNDVSASHLAL